MLTDPKQPSTNEDIPPEVQSLIDEMLAAKQMKIEAIGKAVAKKRDEAVKGRKESGVETIWEEDEEYYQGIDEANRDSHPWTKSASTSGGISREPKGKKTRCTSFFNITRQFVDSGSARMGDILLPAGDWNFSVKATPVQDDAVNQPAPIQHAPGISPEPPAVDPAQAIAEKKAEKAEAWIQDKLIECSYHTEVRMAIEDAARIGVGVLKGPFPKKSTSRKMTTQGGKSALEIVKETAPATKCIDPWDCYPDPGCGENIHDGSYFLERDRLSAYKLKELGELPGYLPDQIMRVLDEGPSKKNYSDGTRDYDKNTESDDKYEVWYFYGVVDVDALDAMSVEIPEKDSHKHELPAVVTLVNDSPIKAIINIMEDNEFPYDVMPWQRIRGQWYGQGIARQGRTAQDMLNASGRALMDNAGLTAGPQIVIREKAIRPADGKWQITPHKVWMATEESNIKSAGDAILAINIPSVQQELTAIIQLAYKMMEDATGIFFIMQGQQGSAPDTVGGMELLHRNASAILRRLARVFDERVTEPHIKRYYAWLLIHGPEGCKGDMKIEAIGSTALVEREIQQMEAVQLLQLSLNPQFGLDPEKAMIEVLKTKRFIPDKFTMDEAKKKNMPAPTIPAVEVAKIKAATEAARLALDKDIEIASNTLAKHQIDVTQSRENVYSSTMAQEVQTNAQMRIEELKVKRELAILQYATQERIGLDKVKADLAAKAMTLRVQQQLSATDHAMTQVAEPAFEPPGRAKPGHAFTE